MATYTIILSDAEDKALGYVAVDKNQWIQNAVHERCRIAMEEIIMNEIERITKNGESISGTKEEIVLNAPILSLQEKEELLNSPNPL